MNNGQRPDYSTFRILVDSPSKKPQLGFKTTAKGLSSLIKLSEPQFTIGIFGSWGSGKTTLMNAIKSELHQQKIVCVDFSAWRYEKEEHLIIPLLDNIREALVKWSDDLVKNASKMSIETKSRREKLSKAAIDVAKTMGKVMASLTAGLSFKLGLPNAFELSYEASKSLSYAKDIENNNVTKEVGDGFSEKHSDPHLSQSIYHACFNSLKNCFHDFQKLTGGTRIVIFIDDLDRCLPTSSVEVLESIKLFFDLNGFVFVVGLDRAVVERCIDMRYSKLEFKDSQDNENVSPTKNLINGSDYLKKIFQVPFSLAPIAIDQIGGLLDSLCEDSNLPEAQKMDLRRRVRIHLNHVVSGMSINPREVKRFINAYTIQMKVKDSLNPEAVLALQTISFRQDWIKLDEALNTYGIEFTIALKEFLAGDAQALDEFGFQEDDMSEDIRSYLGENGPGNALLNVTNLDDYLYSGEATKSSMGGYYIEILRQFKKLRSALLKVSTAENLEELEKYWQRVKKEHALLKDNLFSVSNSRIDKFIHRSIDDFNVWLTENNYGPNNMISEAFNSNDDQRSEDLKKRASNEIKQRIERYQETLRQLRRQSSMRE